MMRATVITRNSDTSWTTTEPWDCNTARLSSFAEPSRFKF
jgi:protein-L-isoaspartate(D-aspartate) O-methyltransferase